MIAFDVGPASPAHAPSVKSVGIFGQLTGSRANEIIADDIEVPNNSATQGMREKLLKAALEFEAIILPGGKITYLGTPQSEESIYNELRNRGYSARIWPVKYPSIDKVDNYGGDLAPMILEKVQEDPSVIGKSTEPDRFSELDLAAREASFGRSGFNLQFMLDTTLSDAERYPLKLSDLIILPLDSEKGPISLAWANHPNLVIEDLPNVGFTGDRFYRPLRIDDEWIPYEGSVMVIDPAGRGQDETSYAVVKQLHGYLFVTALGGLKGGYDDATMTALSKIARDQKVNVVIIEANFGDGMFTRLLQPIISKYHQCALEEVRNHTQKERRIIDTLEPVMNRHRLVIDYDAVQRDIRENQDTPAYSLFYQMTRITPERGALKHDDRLDALAMGVAYWVESMSRDEERAYQEHQQTKLDDELRVFMEHAIGYRAANSGDVRIDFLK